MNRERGKMQANKFELITKAILQGEDIMTLKSDDIREWSKYICEQLQCSTPNRKYYELERELEIAQQGWKYQAEQAAAKHSDNELELLQALAVANDKWEIQQQINKTQQEEIESLDVEVCRLKLRIKVLEEKVGVSEWEF